MHWKTGVAAAVLAASLAFPSIGAEPQGAWSERVQVLYQPLTKSVVRTRLRVWDPEPSRNLDFVWEPDRDAVLGADGTINGSGTLTWRVRGSASYDPRTIYSTYTGAMKNGRPEGKGRLVLRSGEVLEGRFLAGVLNGKGLRIDAAGNRYEGSFVDGLPQGDGRFASISGEIYTGPFVAGKKHGIGETRAAGGTTYRSYWTMGEERDRPRIIADATLGGVLKAQSGGDAGKVEISVAVDARMTTKAEEEGGVAYQHMVRDDDIAIFPADEELNALWNGTAEVTVGGTSALQNRDWEYVPAFVAVEVGTTDGSKAKIDKLELQVAGTEAYRKPMLSISQHLGCVAFRPSFSITNEGWGAVKNMAMTLQFSGEEAGGAASRAFTRAVGDFDEGVDVAIEDIFREAGVDTAKLESKRYSCPSMDAMNVCRAQVFNDVGFGEIADYVWGEDKLFVTARGTLDYDWADDSGQVHKASEPFSAPISVAFIETQGEAECGDGFGGSPEAGRYQDVRFPVGKTDYSIPMPLRGNRNISDYVARLKLQADPNMSAFTRFTVAASFADGSVKKSKPVSFFFMRPRASTFETAIQPAAACYLPEGAYGC